MVVSVGSYGRLLSRVSNEVKTQGEYFKDFFPEWLQEVIIRIERSVACQYNFQTKSYALSAGDKEVELPGLILGQDHKWEVSIKSTLSDRPYGLKRVESSEYVPGIEDSYDANQYSLPSRYWPIGKNNNSSVLLLPPCDGTVSNLYVRGYFHTEFEEWADGDSHWLIDNWPDLMIYGIAQKNYMHYKQRDDMRDAEQMFLAFLLGDEDMGIGGLSQQQKSARQESRQDMRMQLSPDVQSLANIRPPFDRIEDDTYGNYYVTTLDRLGD